VFLQLITAPTAEPLTRDEAKAHLRVDGTAEDTLIDTYLLAARQDVEAACGRALLPQTWELRLPRFPTWRCGIRLPKPPVTAIVSVRTADLAGAETTLDADIQILAKSLSKVLGA
jgi:uncharacterized phiE125 gp8 family phage protein